MCNAATVGISGSLSIMQCTDGKSFVSGLQTKLIAPGFLSCQGQQYFSGGHAEREAYQAHDRADSIKVIHLSDAARVHVSQALYTQDNIFHQQ